MVLLEYTVWKIILLLSRSPTRSSAINRPVSGLDTKGSLISAAYSFPYADRNLTVGVYPAYGAPPYGRSLIPV